MSADLAATVARRDRLVVLSGLVGVTALAWAYIVYLALNMANVDMGLAMPRAQAWGVWDLFLTFVMWAVMMVAMMTPSATSMILTFVGLNRRRQMQQRPLVPTGLFLFGYLLVWAGFSLVATFVQWGLHSAALLSPMMVTTSPLVGGLLLVVAGAFQWTPLKHACLSHCRTPLGFLLTDWREGRRGAILMGLSYGRYCLGCCWFLMGLLFVAGVMNLLWVAAIGVFILIEKVSSAGHWVSRAAGLFLVGWGLWMLSRALVT